MYIYIDALMDRAGGSPAPEGAGNLLTVDSLSVRNMPPFMFTPKCVMVATSSGEVEVFDDDAPEILLANLGTHLESLDGIYAGWYLNQTLLPILTVNAVKYGVRVFGEQLRRLDEKWSKPVGHSIERAFLQGWYPDCKDDDPFHLTLEYALGLCGMPSPDEARKSLGDGLKDTHARLLARISSMSRIHSRYQDLVEWRG